MDPSELMSSKENIQPLRHGRDATKLCTGLQAISDPDAKKMLMARRQEFETLIRDDTVTDPVGVWFEYITWMEQSYPSTSQKSNIRSLLAKCIDKFREKEEYKNDERFVKICIKYATTTDDTISFFNLLYNSKIGVKYALFFIAWAEAYVLTDSFKRADAVYQKGIDYLAQPVETLKNAHRTFQAFLVRKMLNKDELFEPTSDAYNTAGRQAYNKLRLQVQRQKCTVPNVRVGEGVTAPGKFPSSRSQSTKNVPLQIYQDDDEQIKIPQGNGVMNKIKSHTAANKENNKKAGAWTNPENKNVPFEVATARTPFEVHADEVSTAKIDKASVAMPSALKPKIVAYDEFNVDFAKVPLFCLEAHDPTKLPMYCKEKVYAGGMEFQFEELRAMLRRRVAKPQPPDSVEKKPTNAVAATPRPPPSVSKPTEPSSAVKSTSEAVKIHEDPLASQTKPRVIYDSGRKTLKSRVSEEARSARRRITLDCRKPSDGKSNFSGVVRRSLQSDYPAPSKSDAPSESFINQTIHTKEAVDEMQELWFAKPVTPPRQTKSTFAFFVDESCAETVPPKNDEPISAQGTKPSAPFDVFVDESCIDNQAKPTETVTKHTGPIRCNVPSKLDTRPLKNDNKENSVPVNYSGPTGKSLRPVTGILTPSDDIPFQPIQEVDEQEDDDDEEEDEGLPMVGNTTGITETWNFTQAFQLQKITHASTPNVRQTGQRADVNESLYAPRETSNDECYLSNQLINLKVDTKRPSNKPTTEEVKCPQPLFPKEQRTIGEGVKKDLSMIIETSREYKSSSSGSGASTVSKILPFTPGESRYDTQKRFYSFSQTDDSRKTPFALKPHNGCDTMQRTYGYEASNEMSNTGMKSVAEVNEIEKETPISLAEEQAVVRRVPAFGTISMVQIQDEEIDPFSDSLINSLLERVNFPTDYHSNGCHFHYCPLPAIKINSNVTLREKTYAVKKLLGEGAYAKVYKIKDVNTGEMKVVKYQKPATPWEFYIAREIRNRCSNEEMMSCFMNIEEGHFFENASLLLSTPVEYGDLLTAINAYKVKQGRPMSDYLAIYFSVQILDIINSLHSFNIIHGDVKPDNFLVKKVNGNLRLELIDFGRSIDMRLFPKSTTFTRVVTTEGFTCIEMQSGAPWTYQIDLYGVAACIHCLLFGDYMKVQQKSGVWEISKTIPRYLAKTGWKDIFHKLLNVPSCTEMPSLTSLRNGLQEKLDAHGSNTELITLKNFLENH